jgi:hypothetical protein
MKEKQLLEKGLADLAYKAEADHEVQMARAELYKVAKYAIKLHDMLKGVSEQEGLEGWVQAKITKAADYMASVYHHMDYENAFEAVKEAKKKEVKEGGVGNLKIEMEDDAAQMSKEEFIKTHGEKYAHIWDRVQGQMSGDPKYDESRVNKKSIDPYKESLAAKLESKKKTFELDKKTIKQAHKTADKIKDKPKAKKSIGKWAKEKGMDPEGAIYAIATNMAKKK